MIFFKKMISNNINNKKPSCNKINKSISNLHANKIKQFCPKYLFLRLPSNNLVLASNSALLKKKTDCAILQQLVYDCDNAGKYTP